MKVWLQGQPRQEHGCSHTLCNVQLQHTMDNTDLKPKTTPRLRLKAQEGEHTTLLAVQLAYTAGTMYSVVCLSYCCLNNPAHAATTHGATRPPLRTLHASAQPPPFVPRASDQSNQNKRQVIQMRTAPPNQSRVHVLTRHSVCTHEASSSLSHIALSRLHGNKARTDSNCSTAHRTLLAQTSCHTNTAGVHIESEAPTQKSTTPLRQCNTNLMMSKQATQAT